jgi:polyhydroxybutyrate depolymerase
MRLRLLTLLAALALFATACGGSDAADVADDTSEATPAATATPAPAVETDPEPTAEPEPTAAPDPEPTAEPEPEPTEAPEPERTEEPEPAADDAATTVASGCGNSIAPGASPQTFESEGRERTFQLLVPTNYDPMTPTPVVLNWHGLGSDGPQQLGFSDYTAVANRETFLVVAPTGIPGPGDDRNSWELDDSDPTRDDLVLFDDLMTTLTTALCIDESRVYTTGMSNGGYFSSVLVCEAADRIAAAASVAALHHADDCEPSRPVPYIGFHGTDDTTVPYFGGGGSSLLPEGVTIELFEPAIPDEFAEFAADFGCDAEPEESTIGEDVTKYDYQNCAVEMTFYGIENAGHTWPGSAISLAISEGFGLGVTTDDISATEVSWEFFSRHSLSD